MRVEPIKEKDEKACMRIPSGQRSRLGRKKRKGKERQKKSQSDLLSQEKCGPNSALSCDKSDPPTRKVSNLTALIFNKTGLMYHPVIHK